MQKVRDSRARIKCDCQKAAATRLFIGLAVFAIIAVRLGYVQFGQGVWLTEQAEDSWGETFRLNQNEAILPIETA